MPDLTPEVLEELTKLVAAVDQSPVATMRETSINLTRALWLHRHALLAAAQRVQELEQFKIDGDPFRDWAQSYLDGGRWAGHQLDDAIKAELLERDAEVSRLRAKVAELEGDRERYQWLKARYAAIDFAYGHAPSDEFPALVFKMDPGMRASADLDSTIDASRQAGKEEG